ncbi:hypothetical protein ACA910_017133 [Epithemia clementina (nom. ined.)]
MMLNTDAKQCITICNMEIGDLYPIYKIGEEIFTTKSINLYNFWDKSLVVNSYLSDPEFCVMATLVVAAAAARMTTTMATAMKTILLRTWKRWWALPLAKRLKNSWVRGNMVTWCG